MLIDPQVITVNAVAKSMPRVESKGTSAIYQNSDESFTMTISHTKSDKRLRSMARVDQRIVATDPLTSVDDWQTLGVYMIIDRPLVGFTSVQVDQLVTGFKSWLTSGMVGQLFGRES